MSSYFYMLIIASVCGGVCSMLAWGGFEKYIRYVASLVCVCLMIAPFKSINVNDLTELLNNETVSSTPEYPENTRPLAEEMTEKRAEEYIVRILFSEFGIKAVDADIKIDWETEKDAIIESIVVTLKQEDMQCAARAEEYLLYALGGEVKIIEE